MNIQITALTIGRFTKRRQMYFFNIQNLAFAIVRLVNSRPKMDFRTVRHTDKIRWVFVCIVVEMRGNR